MNSNPLVTVLVPICNVEKFLDQCLSSLEGQTYQNLEIICINDGSTDSSRDIIQTYLDRDARFTVIDKPNSGYGDSMNQGLDAAHGKYIAILESDDFMDADGIEYMVGQAEKYQLDFFKCNFWFYWSKATPEHAYRHNFYWELDTADMRGLGVHAPRDYPRIFWAKASIWSAIYNKEFLNKNGIRFLPTPGASYQDAGFTFKVFACANRAKYSGKAFVHYRQDNEHSSVNSKGKVFCTCDEHAEMKRFLEEDRPDLKELLNPVRAYAKYLNYMWNYDRLDDDGKKEFLGRFSEEMRMEIDEGNIPEGCLDGSYYEEPEIPLYQYFNPGQIAEIREIAYNPDFFAARKASLKSQSKKETLENYWNAGGWDSIIELIGKKVRGEI